MVQLCCCILSTLLYNIIYSSHELLRRCFWRIPMTTATTVAVMLSKRSEILYIRVECHTNWNTRSPRPTGNRPVRQRDRGFVAQGLAGGASSIPSRGQSLGHARWTISAGASSRFCAESAFELVLFHLFSLGYSAQARFHLSCTSSMIAVLLYDLHKYIVRSIYVFMHLM